MDSPGSGQEPIAVSGDCDDEPSWSGATDLGTDTIKITRNKSKKCGARMTRNATSIKCTILLHCYNYDKAIQNNF
jgi:hypothetical protein